MTTTHTRSPAGGAFGANGEWYEGGKFINTVEANAKGKAKRAKPAGKQQIEPWVWAVPPENMRSLYARHSGLWTRTLQGLEPVNATALAYYGTTREEVQATIDAFNGGQRWIAA